MGRLVRNPAQKHPRADMDEQAVAKLMIPYPALAICPGMTGITYLINQEKYKK